MLHDNDAPIKTGEDAAFHQEINDLIQRSRNPYTWKIHVLENDLEAFFDYSVKGRAHSKPARMVLALQQGEITQEAVARFTELARSLLMA